MTDTAKKSMKWASALSLDPNLETALIEATAAIRRQLGSGVPDIVFVFVSPHHKAHYGEILPALHKRLGARHILGCSAGGVIGASTEAEQVAALSLTAAIMPDVQITPIRLEDDKLPNLDGSPREWEQLTGVKIWHDESGNKQEGARQEAKPEASPPHFILLADPFSINSEPLVAGLDYAYPSSIKLGGLASGANGPGQNVLFLDQHSFRDGAVALALTGDFMIDTLVAQGSRPMGPPMVVTRCEENIMLELDKRPALEVLHELYQAANPHDQELIRTRLNLGIVMNPFRDEGALKSGDFLMRNILGMDAERGALAVGVLLREGQTIQFHVRDALSASEDLEAVLRQYATERLESAGGDSIPEPPRGALLFSCLGRGLHLYGRPHHDSHTFQSHLGEVPMGGFFCNGEIGPVHETTYIHGFTSCFGIFRSRT